MILSTDHAKQLADFTKYVNRSISAVVKAALSWKAPVWEPRPHYAIILDEAAAMKRFRYLHSNGVKEGLIDHPSESPWVSSAQALLGDGEVVAYWASAADRRSARRRGESEDARDCGKEYRVVFTPLPGLERFSVDERRAVVAETFDDIAREARIARQGRPSLGHAAVLAPQPLEPREIEESPGPVVHATSETEQEEFLATRALFIDEFRKSSRRLSAGELDTAFPPGSLPPNRPFVPWPPSVSLLWSVSRLATATRSRLKIGPPRRGAVAGAARGAWRDRGRADRPPPHARRSSSRR